MLRATPFLRFIALLTAVVVLSIVLSYFVPAELFDNAISPILIAATTTAALIGAWIVSSHTDGLKFRKVWAWTLLVWGLADGAYLVLWVTTPGTVMNMGAYQLTTLEILIGNLLGWMLLLYPTEALRPGWLTWRKVLWQLLPMLALVALDYAIPMSLYPLLSLYPFVLLSLLLTHVKAYKKWCEENFSTLDNIDVEWIMRYLAMVIVVGCIYMYLLISHSPTRGLTQLWLVIFLIAYSSEKILFQKDPWQMIRQTERDKSGQEDDRPNTALRKKLEEWMSQEKPYANPDLQLADLGQVLPLNRTYLSRFIHSEFHCSFYQFVNQYRIEEAKRLKTEFPELQIQEISARCGFSSPTVFSRTFTAITGMSPREWAKQIHSA